MAQKIADETDRRILKELVADARLTNNELAEKSLKDLSAYVREMRILKAKLDRLDGKYKLLPPGAVTTAASQ